MPSQESLITQDTARFGGGKKSLNAILKQLGCSHGDVKKNPLQLVNQKIEKNEANSASLKNRKQTTLKFDKNSQNETTSTDNKTDNRLRYKDTEIVSEQTTPKERYGGEEHEENVKDAVQEKHLKAGGLYETAAVTIPVHPNRYVMTDSVGYEHHPGLQLSHSASLHCMPPQPSFKHSKPSSCKPVSDTGPPGHVADLLKEGTKYQQQSDNRLSEMFLKTQDAKTFAGLLQSFLHIFIEGKKEGYSQNESKMEELNETETEKEDKMKMISLDANTAESCWEDLSTDGSVKSNISAISADADIMRLKEEGEILKETEDDAQNVSSDKCQQLENSEIVSGRSLDKFVTAGLYRVDLPWKKGDSECAICLESMKAMVDSLEKILEDFRGDLVIPSPKRQHKSLVTDSRGYKFRSSMNSHSDGGSYNGGQGQGQGSGGYQERGNGGGGRGDSGDRSGQWPGRDGQGDEGDDGRHGRSTLPTLDSRDMFNVPTPNHKYFRQKEHAHMSNVVLSDCLGAVGTPNWRTLHEKWQQELNKCLEIILHNVASTDDILECDVCTILQSLLCHFINNKGCPPSCCHCLKTFYIIQFHLDQCLSGVRRDKPDTASDVCFQVIAAVQFDRAQLRNNSDRLWTKIHKNLTKVLGQVLDAEEVSEISDVAAEFQLPDGQVNSPDLDRNFNPSASLSFAAAMGFGPRAGARHASYTPSLSSIPETETSSKVKSATAGGARPKRKKSVRIPSVSNDYAGYGSHGSITSFSEVASGFGNPADSMSSRTSQNSFPSAERSEGSRGDQSVMDKIYNVYRVQIETQGSIDPGTSGKVLQDSPYDTQKTYGPSGILSLPVVHQGQRTGGRGSQQLMSLEMHPVGEPGIGEVVYGSRQQLLILARYWNDYQEDLENVAKYPVHIREEGVILAPYKKGLKILKTRYQKHYQWRRLTHLGNGVAGKCHLAMDLTTKHIFCVKRVHLMQFEKSELDIWSELDHPNIVKLFGAVRHGQKVYIFAEFIDGGSLSACIAIQRNMNRRLSHWTALSIFKQILQVLIYLKSKGIIHEDLKADNILLRSGSTQVAVADFGMAQRVNKERGFSGKSPLGAPTQWSPEKAASEGHGYAADVWAAICVLVNMLSGFPPWIRRFSNAAMLHFIIVTQSPPLEDIPTNIQRDVRELIEKGFTQHPEDRPSAEDLLNHPAFQLLGKDDENREVLYSTLQLSDSINVNNRLEDQTNQDLQEILDSLKREHLESVELQPGNRAEHPSLQRSTSSRTEHASICRKLSNGTQQLFDLEHSSNDIQHQDIVRPAISELLTIQSNIDSRSQALGEIRMEQVQKGITLFAPVVGTSTSVQCMRTGLPINANGHLSHFNQDPVENSDLHFGKPAGAEGTQTPACLAPRSSTPQLNTRGESVTDVNLPSVGSPPSQRYNDVFYPEPYAVPLYSDLQISTGHSLESQAESRQEVASCVNNPDTSFQNPRDRQTENSPAAENDLNMYATEFLREAQLPNLAITFPPVRPELPLFDHTKKKENNQRAVPNLPVFEEVLISGASRNPNFLNAVVSPWQNTSAAPGQQMELISPQPSLSEANREQVGSSSSNTHQDFTQREHANSNLGFQEVSDDLDRINSIELFSALDGGTSAEQAIISAASNSSTSSALLEKKLETSGHHLAMSSVNKTCTPLQNIRSPPTKGFAHEFVDNPELLPRPMTCAVAVTTSSASPKRNPLDLHVDVTRRVNRYFLPRNTSAPDQLSSSKSQLPTSGRQTGEESRWHQSHSSGSLLGSPPNWSANNGARISPVQLSGSSRSTSYSSDPDASPYTPRTTYDEQEEAFRHLNKMEFSFSELGEAADLGVHTGSSSISNFHFSLLEPNNQEYESQLELLQSQIDVGGSLDRFLFLSEAKETLCQLRVPPCSRDWATLRDLALPKIKDAGYPHFTLRYSDGTPVIHTASPTEDQTEVVVLPVDENDPENICWCEGHLML